MAAGLTPSSGKKQHPGAPIPDTQMISAVEDAILRTAATEIMPRFRHLTSTDVAEKAPGDLVTVADRAAEASLADQLKTILPGSLVVGEERAAVDPSVLSYLAGPEPVWIIDPIDGTRNFVAGNPQFATLVTLAHRGLLLASWTHSPALGITATALHGGGARLNGVPMGHASSYAVPPRLRVVTSNKRWWPKNIGYMHNRLREHGAALSPLGSCGLDYVSLAAGHCDAMVLTWDYPWDHAAGILLLTEANGVAVGLSGEPYQLVGENELPLVAARTSPIASSLLDAMR